MPVPRYAISYTPPPDSPLARFGAGVLGYDCFYRTEVPRRRVDGIDPAVLTLATVAPRRYGFHGLLVGPFRLKDQSEAALIEAADRLARSHPPLPVGPLGVASHNRSVVLRPLQQHAWLDEFAAACLEAFDPFRAPLSPAERHHLLADGLDTRQAALLDRWGYPYVLDEFRFHMTLAGPIPDGESASFEALLQAAFSARAADQLELDAISLMRQDDTAGAFHVLTRRRLTGR